MLDNPFVLLALPGMNRFRHFIVFVYHSRLMHIRYRQISGLQAGGDVEPPYSTYKGRLNIHISQQIINPRITLRSFYLENEIYLFFA